MRARPLDCSGCIRMVLGYRGARYPLMSSDTSGDGLPRTANGMARSRQGVNVLPLTGISAQGRPTAIEQLQPAPVTHRISLLARRSFALGEEAGQWSGASVVRGEESGARSPGRSARELTPSLGKAR